MGKAQLELSKGAVEQKLADLELMDQLCVRVECAERAATRERLLRHAEKEGPDHASRPPRAVYDMRGWSK